MENSEDQLVLVLLAFSLVVLAILKFQEKKEPEGPDDSYLIDAPDLPFIDLRPWNFEQRNGMVGFFGDQIRDFPSQWEMSGFFFKDKNSGFQEGDGRFIFRIFGWEINNLDPDHPHKKYYEDPLLRDKWGREHIWVKKNK